MAVVVLVVGSRPFPWIALADGADPPRPQGPRPVEAATAPPSLVAAFLFQPRKYVESEWPAPDPTVEDAWFETPDGLRLNGWFAAAERPRAFVLCAGGNAGNIAGRRSVLRLFRDRMRASVLIFDYRGYGRSEGTPT